ncbi:MAG: PqqD family protein [Candidatus Electrothrix sp.]
MKNSQKFTLNPDFTTEEFEDEILLYAVATGKGVYLNKTAGLVREMCGKGQGVEEIIALLEAAFPEQKNDIRHDVETAVEVLLVHGALLQADE